MSARREAHFDLSDRCVARVSDAALGEGPDADASGRPSGAALAFPNSADRALENLWREPRVNEYRVGKLAAELEPVATFAQLGVTILRFFIAASKSQL